MMFLGIDLQRIARRADHRAGLLVDDAMISRDDGRRGWSTATTASTPPPLPTAPRPPDAETARWSRSGFRADRLPRRSGAGEIHLLIFAVVGIALVASWIVAVLFAPARGLDPEEAQDRPSRRAGPIMRAFRRFLVLAMRARWATVLARVSLFGAALLGTRYVPQRDSSVIGPAGALVDPSSPTTPRSYASRTLRGPRRRSS